MFGEEFQIIICIALAVITVLLFLGKSDFLLRAKNETKKQTPEERQKFSRGLSYFTALWLFAELAVIFLGDMQWVGIAYLVVVILSFIGLVIYSKKNA